MCQCRGRGVAACYDDEFAVAIEPSGMISIGLFLLTKERDDGGAVPWVFMNRITALLFGVD